MIKWLAWIVACLIILIIYLYLFLPRIVSIDRKLEATINLKTLQRGVLDEKTWKAWWPGKKVDANGKTFFEYNGYTYSITDKQLSTITLSVQKENFSTTAVINFIPRDETHVIISGHINEELPAMPVNRIRTYLHSKALSNDLGDLLEHIKQFYSNNDHVYGFHIEKAIVKDSSLISTSGISKGYPQPPFIYKMINDLKAYALSHDAKQTDYPMLNVYTQDSINFLTRVALPVNKKLPSSGNIEYRWMLGGGNILVTEVKGGPGSINAAIHQVENYITDYNRVPPAISFQSLLTDRTKEPDTAKWITKLYYPVM
jgi:ACT domain-containing protein